MVVSDCGVIKKNADISRDVKVIAILQTLVSNRCGELSARHFSDANYADPAFHAERMAYYNVLSALRTSLFNLGYRSKVHPAAIAIQVLAMIMSC